MRDGQYRPQASYRSNIHATRILATTGISDASLTTTKALVLPDREPADRNAIAHNLESGGERMFSSLDTRVDWRAFRDARCSPHTARNFRSSMQ